MQTWVIEYNGVPPAEVFSTTAGFGTPIVIDMTTGFAYFYKTGVGVTLIDSPAGGGISDHGALTGLLDDDHPQYLTEARGDLLYAPLSHVGSSGDTEHALATTTTAGFLSPADKVKIDTFSGDAWTYLVLTADLDATSSIFVLSDLTFTPEASALYVVEGQLAVETSVPATGPGISIGWPTGLSFGVGEVRITAGLSEVTAFGNSTAAVQAVSTNLPASGVPFPATIKATFQTSAAPAGDFAVSLATE